MGRSRRLVGTNRKQSDDFPNSAFDPRQILRRVGVKDRCLVTAVSDLSFTATRKQPYGSWMRNRAAITRSHLCVMNRRNSFLTGFHT